MLNYDIVIIDSGANVQNISGFHGICIEKNNSDFYYCDSMKDDIGHGTIIFNIINREIDISNIYMIKLSNLSEDYDDSSLIAALKYIKTNVKCKLINISLGIQTGESIQELYEICKELSEAGTVIVSAFDNEGCYSYPAAFDCVVGVESSQNLKSIEDFDYVEGSPINVFAKGNIQRLMLENGITLLVGGSSVACAHVTSFLANAKTPITDITSALSYLKDKALYIFEKDSDICKCKLVDYNINNAIVFPFSKEAQAFLRFSDMLSFNIKDYYDVPKSGKVGRKLSSYYNGVSTNAEIKNIENVDFMNVDTLILGHLDRLNGIFNYDYRLDLIKKAIKANVNIYSFDSLDKYVDLFNNSDIKYFYPSVTSFNIPQNSFGKLYKIDKPVVGIFGTSSNQGKFSLQLTLKNKLESVGYNVGTIGTEPHSLLFGFDVIFPMGYNSTVQLNNNEAVLFLNDAINNLCRMQKEIILVSSQAQTVPYSHNNLLEIPTLQYHFALGTKPDAIILCINFFDDLSYIENSINALIGLTKATIIAFVMHPITYVESWNGAYGKKQRYITKDEFVKKATEIEKEFNIPVHLLGDDNSMCDLVDLILNFF